MLMINTEKTTLCKKEKFDNCLLSSGTPIFFTLKFVVNKQIICDIPVLL